MKIHKITILFSLFLCNSIVVCSEQRTQHASLFLRIQKFHIDKPNGRELIGPNGWGDLFMPVELLVKEEENNKVLFLKRTGSMHDTRAPLTMVSAYHLCKEIERVTTFTEDAPIERMKLGNKEDHDVKFFIEQRGNAEWTYCVRASQKHVETATSFLSWVENKLIHERENIELFVGAPERDIHTTRTMDWGRVGQLPFVGAELDFNQQFFEDSLDDNSAQNSAEKIDPNFVRISTLYIGKRDGVERAFSFGDGFMGVMLHLKKEPQGYVLLLKRKNNESKCDEYVPLTMLAAYHLCKEIIRVSCFSKDLWYGRDEKENAGYRINFDIQKPGKINGHFPFPEWAAEMSYSLCASDEHQVIAQEFCKWVDQQITEKQRTVVDIIGDSIRHEHNGSIECGRFDTPYYFIGTPLNLQLSFFRESSDNDFKILEQNGSWLEKELEKRKKHLFLKRLFFGMIGGSLLCLIVMSYLTQN